MSLIRPILVALTATTLALSGCEREREPAPPAAEPGQAAQPTQAAETVLALARSDAEFTTLVSALQTAEMEETLEGAGPFTIFAPTNAAFEKIPAERRDALTRPEGRADLQRLLGYHVVPGRLDAAALIQRIQTGGGSLALTTLQGGELTARVNPDGSVSLTDASGGASKVVESDIRGRNGVIHAIDTVVEPG